MFNDAFLVAWLVPGIVKSQQGVFVMVAKSIAAKAILVFSFDFKKAETEAKTTIS